jgi:8-oxo-dGTP pyrophosphatase MutT (NUDIX family)
VTTGPSQRGPRVLPEQMQERARALAAGDRESWTPPTPRDAATVCLLRERPGGLEVFLLRRSKNMSFAAGMYVFPGGSVDPSDMSLDLSGPGDWELMGRRSSSRAPRALLAAAVRETFEEAAVLLAVNDDGRAPATDDRFETDRQAVLDGRLDLRDLLGLRALHLDPALLPLVGHWVTPEVEARRFDTRFFVAAMPEGQIARDVGGESDHGTWVRPADALAAYTTGELGLLPPTHATLRWLSGWATVPAALEGAANAVVRPILPRPLPDGAGGVRWGVVDARTGEELSWAATSVTTALDPAAMAAFFRRGPAGSESQGVASPLADAVGDAGSTA